MPAGSKNMGGGLQVNATELASAVGQKVRIVGVIAGGKGVWHLVLEDQTIYFDRAVDSELLGRHVEVVGLLEIEHVKARNENSTDDVVQSDHVEQDCDRFVIRDFLISPK